MAQGRPLAWSKLFHRFTAQGELESEPQLADNQLVGLILSVEVGNERRSTTRYVADVIFHFNPAAVRQLLLEFNIGSEALSVFALVIPLTIGKPDFDPASPWAIAWAGPSLQRSLGSLVVLTGDDASNLLIPLNLTELDWEALAPLTRRYHASQVILAIASEDARTIQMIEVSAMGRAVLSFAYPQASFAAGAKAIAEEANERGLSIVRQSVAIEPEPDPIVDGSTGTHLTADVRFDTLQDWATLRARLGAVKSVTKMDVVGLALHEAQIDLAYSGQLEPLRDALKQENLELSSIAGQYMLENRTATAANSQ
jgi:hypothetical protein